MATIPVSKPIIPFMDAPHPSEEKGLASSPFKYIAIALIVGAIAGGVFATFFPLAVALIVISAWFLWSGVIILTNRAAEGTKFEKPIHHLHAIAMEVNSGIASAYLFPLTFFSRYHQPKGHLDGRPILMVNGYLSFGSTWHYQRTKLAEAGFGPIYTMNVGSGRSIKTYANHVQEKVNQIQSETGRNDLILIGHSKGGLVSSYYATHLADKTQTEVTDVVTIGSPLAGTPMASIGWGRDAKEMRLNSQFHQDLREKINQQALTRFFHIASETDEVVPRSSALIGKDGSRQLLLKDTGHLGLVFSSRVSDQICKWLKH